MKIPIDLVIISEGIYPSQLSDNDLATLVYAKWFKISDVRLGEHIAVSAATVEGVNINFQSIEDAGFSIKDIAVEEINQIDKKWNEHRGFFI